MNGMIIGMIMNLCGRLQIVGTLGTDVVGRNYMKRYIAFVLFAVILVVLLNLFSVKRENLDLEISGIMHQFEISNKLGVLIGEIEYYEDVEVLAEMIQLDKWEKIKRAPESGGDEIMSIHLQELYDIFFYSDYIKVYDGYPLSSPHRKEAYYRVPQEVIENVCLYVEKIKEEMSKEERKWND